MPNNSITIDIAPTIKVMIKLFPNNALSQLGCLPVKCTFALPKLPLKMLNNTESKRIAKENAPLPSGPKPLAKMICDKKAKRNIPI